MGGTGANLFGSTSASGIHKEAYHYPDGVSLEALNRFLFPPHLEHPESTGRLDLFAYYGPVSTEGTLNGGPGGTHRHTDLEIRQMITELNLKQLYKILARPRETVQTIVQEMLPKAVAHHYTARDVQKMFSGLEADDQGCYRFSEMQDVILADQKRRLVTLVEGGEIQKTARRAIPFQSRPQEILGTVMTKKKLKPCEDAVVLHKRMNRFAGLVAPLEQQNLSAQINANTQLVRPAGSVNDRWDRYCAVRRTGKISYVGARNTHREPLGGDDRLADKAPFCSTLTSSFGLNGPLGRRC